MRAILLRSVLVIGIGAVVLAGLLYVASTFDSRAPTVAEITLTQPLPDSPTVALITTSLAVEFSEPVETASAPDAIELEPTVEGSVSWSGSTMLFTPRDPLALLTTYTVTIGEGIRDLAGNPMTDLPEPFTFETTGPPEVVETVPADGATDVALDGPISVSFSTLMDTASVEASLRLRPAFPHELRWSGLLLEIVPDRPLETDREYEITVGEGAFDLAGVTLEVPVTLTFRTVSSGLRPSVLVPSDGTDGIAPTSPIAVMFDRPVDPDSLTGGELLTITPDVAGSLALVDANGEEPADPSEAVILRFAPSGPLPPNTTFVVELGTAITSLSGEGLAGPVTWSFTTGASQLTLSNQITFLSERAGVANLWAMNPDGTAPRQLSTELTPILDYAVAPDGSSFVVGDGRRLVFAEASGADRRVLTDDGFVDFDPTYSPNGQRIAFGRADAESGLGLGLWERTVDGGDVARIELDGEVPATPGASGTADDGEVAQWLRAPRYAPDGRTLAYVDLAGSVGIVDLESGEVVRVAYAAHAPPTWLPDGSAILVTGRRLDRPLTDPAFDDVVEPLEPSGDFEVEILDPTNGTLEDGGFGTGARVAATAADGRIAIVRGDGSLRIADGPDDAGDPMRSLGDDRIGAVTFAPGEEAIAVVVLEAGDDTARGSIERVELDDGARDILMNEGWRPRWLP